MLLLLPKNLGNTPGLKGHIYNIGVTNQSYFFASTTKMSAGYAGKVCKEPSVIFHAIERLEAPSSIKPTLKMTGDAKVNKLILQNEVKTCNRREENYQMEPENIHFVILSQCTNVTKAKLKVVEDGDKMSKASDPIGLLLAVHGTSYNSN